MEELIRKRKREFGKNDDFAGVRLWLAVLFLAHHSESLHHDVNCDSGEQEERSGLEEGWQRIFHISYLKFLKYP